MPRPTRSRRTPKLELALFGPLRLLADEVPIELPTRKLQAIIAHLALEGSATRAGLAALLWESNEGRARANLRSELYRLRDTPFAAALEEDAGRLRLTATLETDLMHFDRLLARGDWAQALELRRGALLEGFELVDAPGFEDWLLLLRERWQERWNEALAAHAAQLMALKNWLGAREAFEHLIEFDPWREEAMRGLMRALAQAGEAPRALERFERFAQSLRENLGVEPSQDSNLLAQELRQARATRVAWPKAQLVGRESEWVQLEAAWQAGKIIFVAGEPGVGKTRLMQEFAAQHGSSTLIECGPSDAVAPYALIARHLRERLPHSQLERIPHWVQLELARLVPEFLTNGSDALSSEGKGRLFEAITQFLLHEWRGSNLLLDNAQFFDPISFELGLFMCARASQAKPAMRSIMTFRNGELKPEMQAQTEKYLRAGQAILLKLEPLGPTGVKAMLAQTQSKFDVEDLHRITGGNPFFVLETLRVIESNPSTTDSPLAHSPQVAQLLKDRIERLSKAARDLARVAAIAGPVFNLILAARVLDTDALALTEDTETLEQHGILRAGRFSHDLMLEAVLHDTPMATQTLLHARLLEALEARPFERGQAAELLRHARAAQNTPRSAHWAERAAFEALEQFAAREARSFFAEALEQHAKLWPDAHSVELRLGLEESLHQLGQRDAQQFELTRLQALRLEDAQSAELAYRFGRLFEALGQYENALLHYAKSGLQKAALREVYMLEKLGSLEDAARRAETIYSAPDGVEEAFQAALLRAELAFEHWEAKSSDAWFARAEALIFENPMRRLQWLRSRSRRAYHAGTLEDSLGLILAGQTLAGELGANQDLLNFTNAHALVLLRLQRFAAAIDAFLRVRHDAERLVAPAQYFAASGNLRLVYARTGAFAQSMQLVPEIEAYAAQHELPIDRAGLELISGLTHAYAGRGFDARACFEAMFESLTDSTDFYFRASVMHGLALAATLEQNFVQAEAYARTELELTVQRSDPDWVIGQTTLALAVARQGRLEAAQELSDQALAALLPDRLELPSEPVPWVNAQIHHALGNHVQAQAALEQASLILKQSSAQLAEDARAQYLESFRWAREILAALEGFWPEEVSML